MSGFESAMAFQHVMECGRVVTPATATDPKPKIGPSASRRGERSVAPLPAGISPRRRLVRAPLGRAPDASLPHISKQNLHFP
jgi:hypothetical protein